MKQVDLFNVYINDVSFYSKFLTDTMVGLRFDTPLKRKYGHCSKCGNNDWYTRHRYGKKTGIKHISRVCKTCANVKRRERYWKLKNTNRERWRETCCGKNYKRYIKRFIGTSEELKAIKEFYKNTPEGYHVDHIIPLHGKHVSGLHVLSNLQYLTAEENIRKTNTFEEDK